MITQAADVGTGVGVLNPRDIHDRNSTYTYQTPGSMRSDSGDGPRRIAATSKTAPFDPAQLNSDIFARAKWRGKGVAR